MMADEVAEKTEQTFKQIATSKGLDPDRLETSLNKIKGNQSQQATPIEPRGGAATLNRALEGQKPSPAQRVGEAVAQEQNQQRRVNEALYGIADSGGSLPSQRPPAENAPGWLKHEHEETQRRTGSLTAEEQAEIERIDQANLAKAQGVPQEKTEEPVK